MKIINFMAPNQSHGVRLLIDCWSKGFRYHQARTVLVHAGYDLPLAIYTAAYALYDAQLSHDIGGK